MLKNSEEPDSGDCQITFLSFDTSKVDTHPPVVPIQKMYLSES